ncbi:MAG: GTP-binding protein EngB [Methanotrichaceae archaeon]
MAKEIVLIGRSNVGKSTLFKALTGKKVRVGRRPGITRYHFKVQVMLHVSKADLDRTKNIIVDYFEENASEILLAIQVIDVASFLDIADRWEGRGEVPLEIELYEFLSDLGLDVVVAANKMDRIAKKDEDWVLDAIAERLGMLPPWRQWSEKIAPISAKSGQVEPLQRIIRDKLAKG